jgi:hypothetical protein
MKLPTLLLLLVSILPPAAHNLLAAAPSPSPIVLDLKAEETHRVVTAADRYMSERPRTITSYPAPRSPGGPHDYYSEADYYWPDPAHPGASFTHRDGQSNPTNFVDHRLALRRFDIQVADLVAAYLITGKESYARHAVDHLRAWFITPAARMNPNLQYAQAERQHNTGNAIGIIDTIHLIEVARSVVVLRQHHLLAKADDQAITKWFADYLTWMTTSAAGIKEGSAKNNHATCYWLQVAAFAQVTGDQAKLDECRKRYKEQLLPQMAADGSFPLELARTKPYGYSIFDLDQMVMLCQVASTPKDDLWTFALPDGRAIRRGLEFLYPYIKDKSTWPHKPDVMVYQYWPVRGPAWLFGGLAFNEQKYIDLWKSLDPDPTNLEVLRNIAVHQPLIWTDGAPK